MEQDQIKSHAELEQYHYQALSNPLYALEGMADVLREDLMMNMPAPRQEPINPPEQIVIHRQSNMNRQDYDLLQQTARETKHLREMLKGHLQPKKKSKSSRTYKGIK